MASIGAPISSTVEGQMTPNEIWTMIPRALLSNLLCGLLKYQLPLNSTGSSLASAETVNRLGSQQNTPSINFLRVVEDSPIYRRRCR